MAERMRVTSFIATAAVGRPGRTFGPSPSDVARLIASGPVWRWGGSSPGYHRPDDRDSPGYSPRWRRGRPEELSGGEMGIVSEVRPVSLSRVAPLSMILPGGSTQGRDIRRIRTGTGAAANRV